MTSVIARISAGFIVDLFLIPGRIVFTVEQHRDGIKFLQVGPRALRRFSKAGYLRRDEPTVPQL